MSEVALPTKYNLLTRADRKAVRERYVELQNNKCMYCGESLEKEPPLRVTEKTIDWSLFPENFLRYPVHLQHDHKTGMTEGAVHAYCNAVMWQYERR